MHLPNQRAGFVVAALSIVFPFLSVGEGAAQTCLTIEDAIYLATSENPAVRGAEEALIAASADRVIARALTRPQLSVFAQSAAGEVGLVASDFNNQVGLRASQRLFDYGDARLARQAAKEGESSLKYEVDRVEMSVALEVGLLFVDWVQSSEELEVTVERIQYFGREMKALEMALPLGGATRTEIAELSAEKASAQAARAQLELRRRNAAIAVSVLTKDERSPCEHGLEAYFLGKPDPAADGFDFDEAMAIVLRQNAELNSLRSSAARSRAEAERQAKERLPVIEVVGIASLSANDLNSQPDPTYRLGVDVSVPVFSGAALNGRSKSANAAAARARADVDLAAMQIERRLRESVQSLIYLTAQISTQADVARHRRLQFESVQQEYERGVATLPRIVDARIDLESDLLALVRSKHNRNRAHLELLSDLHELN